MCRAGVEKYFEARVFWCHKFNANDRKERHTCDVGHAS